MAWYGTPGWSYRVKVTIDGADGSTQTDFPVLITGDNFPAGFWSNVDSAGDDIVCTADDGTTKLKRELVSITTGSSYMELYVKIPSHTTSNKDIYIYYGNAGASETNDTDTWDANYLAVYHMNDDPDSAGTQQDSTGNNKDGTSAGTMTSGDLVNGAWGAGSTAWDFDGSDDYMDLDAHATYFEGYDVGTFECWANITSGSGTATMWHNGLASHAVNANYYAYWIGSVTGYYANESITSRVAHGGTDYILAVVQKGHTFYADDTWHSFAWTVGSVNGSGIFVDGVDETDAYRFGNDGTQEFTDVGSVDTSKIGVHYLGNPPSLANFMDGPIDEIRISSIGRTNDYMLTAWRNLQSPGDYFAVAAQESNDVTAAPAVSDVNLDIPAVTVTRTYGVSPGVSDVYIDIPAPTVTFDVTALPAVSDVYLYTYSPAVFVGDVAILPRAVDVRMDILPPAVTRTPTPPGTDPATVTRSEFVRMSTKASLLSMFKEGEPLVGGRKFGRLMEGVLFKNEYENASTANQIAATGVVVNTTNFDNVLSSADDTVQKALDTIDDAGLGDHGALTGLGDDDHLQYLTEARGDVRYYTKATVDSKLDLYLPLTAGSSKALTGNLHIESATNPRLTLAQNGSATDYSYFEDQGNSIVKIKVIVDGASATLDIDAQPNATGDGIIEFFTDTTTSGDTYLINRGTNFQTDVIQEATGSSGVTIEGVLLKDNDIETCVNADLSGTLKVDTITEYTGANGVQIEGVDIDTGVVTTAAGASLIIGDSSGSAAIVMRKSDASLCATYYQSAGANKWSVQVDSAENFLIYDETNAASRFYATQGGDTQLLVPTGQKASIGTGANVVDISEVGVYLEGTSTMWDDLRVPALATRVPATADPDFAQWKDNGAASTGVFLYWFDDGTEEQVYFTAQMPHAWDEGTDIEAHVHWTPADTAPGSGTDVCWGLEYTWVDINEVAGNTTIIYGDEQSNGSGETITVDKHYLTELGTITGTGYTLSSQIVCRLFRDATGAGGTDDYDDDAGFLEFDFHYQINSFGSKEEYTKGP